MLRNNIGTNVQQLVSSKQYHIITIDKIFLDGGNVLCPSTD